MIGLGLCFSLAPLFFPSDLTTGPEDLQSTARDVSYPILQPRATREAQNSPPLHPEHTKPYIRGQLL